MTPHSRVQEGLGVVLENRHLFGEMSVQNNLDLARVEGARRQVAHRFTLEDVISLFPFIGQRLQSQVAVLSGGEQQMVAIARALLLQPDVLILDEPSTGLAPKVLSHIAEVVAGLRSYGISILLIEQNVAFAAKIADRAYVMSLGRVVREIPAGQWDRVVRDQTLLRAYLGGDPRMPQTTH
jgi:ABC-type branched-subunit amino acid transport system ATPase component